MRSIAPLVSVLALATPSLSLPAQDAALDRPWHLKAINYGSQLIYSTPAHLAVSVATISFNVTNRAADYRASCSGSSFGQQSSASFFAFPQNFTCQTTPKKAGAAVVGAADFSFVLGSKKLEVNETFSKKGQNYLGVADVTLDLSCNTTRYQNHNWTIGQIYSSETVACKPIDLLTVTPVLTKQ